MNIKYGKRVCKKCGLEMDDTIKYCPRCHKKQFYSIQDVLIDTFIYSNITVAVLGLLFYIAKSVLGV